MILLGSILGLAAFLAALSLVGGARRRRQADTIADLKRAESVHEKAASSRTPIDDPDSVLRAHGKLRD